MEEHLLIEEVVTLPQEGGCETGHLTQVIFGHLAEVCALVVEFGKEVLAQGQLEGVLVLCDLRLSRLLSIEGGQQLIGVDHQVGGNIGPRSFKIIIYPFLADIIEFDLQPILVVPEHLIEILKLEVRLRFKLAVE